MTDKLISEAEAVRRERKAFRQGVNHHRGCSCHSEPCCDDDPKCRAAIEEAKRRYPLPKKVVPRVVTDKAGDEWRVVDDKLEYRSRVAFDRERWYQWTYLMPSVIADLFARPTEEVPDDA